MSALIAMALGALGALYTVAPFLRGGDDGELPEREEAAGQDERGEIEAERAWSVCAGELVESSREGNHQDQTVPARE